MLGYFWKLSWVLFSLTSTGASSVLIILTQGWNRNNSRLRFALSEVLKNKCKFVKYIQKNYYFFLTMNFFHFFFLFVFIKAPNFLKDIKLGLGWDLNKIKNFIENIYSSFPLKRLAPYCWKLKEVEGILGFNGSFTFYMELPLKIFLWALKINGGKKKKE